MWFLALAGACDQQPREGELSGEPTRASAAAPEVSLPTATSSAAPAATGATAATAERPLASPEGMTLIPEGFFVMGGESPENTPRIEVAVARFYLDSTEVTVDAYGACVKAGVCQPMKNNNPFCSSHFPDHGQHAVNCVDWNDATTYCKWRNTRLPTEREWEYAARGGAEQRLYSWGNEEPTKERACYMHSGSCKVKSYPAGAFGLFDMTGNVWEWTSTSFVPYDKPEAEGFTKINRGGSWSRRFAKWMRNDLRSRFKPEEQSAAHGFRCAADFAPTTCPKDAAWESGSCVRKSGTSLCPAGSDCRPAPGPAQALVAGPALSGRLPAGSSAPPADSSSKPAADPPKRVRAPAFDADCQANFPGTPVGYQWVGGAAFHEREPLIRAAGCKKRDVGVGWTSTCCPQ